MALAGGPALRGAVRAGVDLGRQRPEWQGLETCQAHRHLTVCTLPSGDGGLRAGSWEEHRDPTQPAAQDTTIATPSCHLQAAWKEELCTAYEPCLAVREAESWPRHTQAGGFRGHLASLSSPSFSWDTEVLHPCDWQPQQLTGDSRHLDWAWRQRTQAPLSPIYAKSCHHSYQTPGKLSAWWKDGPQSMQQTPSHSLHWLVSSKGPRFAAVGRWSTYEPPFPQGGLPTPGPNQEGGHHGQGNW